MGGRFCWSLTSSRILQRDSFNFSVGGGGMMVVVVVVKKSIVSRFFFFVLIGDNKLSVTYLTTQLENFSL